MYSNHIMVKGVRSEASGSPKPFLTPGHRGIITISRSTRSMRRIPAALSAISGMVSMHQFKATSNLLFGFTHVIAFWTIGPKGFLIRGKEELLYAQKIYKEVADPPHRDLWLAPEKNMKFSKKHGEYAIEPANEIHHLEERKPSDKFKTNETSEPTLAV